MRMIFSKSPFGDSGKSVLQIFVFFAMIVPSGSQVFADIYITASESGGNTTIEWSGSLDVAKLDFVGTVEGPAGSIFPRLGLISGSSDKKLDAYLLRSVQPRSFGKGAATLPVSSSGDPFLITNTVSGNEVCLCFPAGYKGGPVRGSLTFDNTTIHKLGLDMKPFAYDLGGQSLYFFPTSDSFTHPGNAPLKKLLSKVFSDRERKVIKIRAFVEPAKRQTGTRDLEDPEVALVEVRPVSAR